MHQILEGVDYLHSNKVFHRDLKPENILVSKAEDLIKICDFGLARTFHQPLRPYTHEVMSLWYRSPELCINSNSYSIGVDTWAIGCIFAIMMTGRPIFQAKVQSELLINIIDIIGNPPKNIPYLPEEMRIIFKNIPNK